MFEVIPLSICFSASYLLITSVFPVLSASAFFWLSDTIFSRLPSTACKAVFNAVACVFASSNDAALLNDSIAWTAAVWESIILLKLAFPTVDTAADAALLDNVKAI